MKKHSSLLAVLFVLSLFFSQCKKDDDKPAYVGTWELTETDTQGSYKTTLTITESSLTMIMAILLNQTIWYDWMGMKTDLSVNGEDATLTLTEVGAVNYENIEDGINWYSPTDEGFDALAEELGANESDQIITKITVSGNQLTVKMDRNGDGDYEDDEETQVFTKV